MIRNILLANKKHFTAPVSGLGVYFVILQAQQQGFGHGADPLFGKLIELQCHYSYNLVKKALIRHFGVSLIRLPRYQ
jgi:hypothetical protein